jgi:hypothetical protein
MSDGSMQLSFKKKHPREIGAIINDDQKIFRTTIHFIWKGPANISMD